MTDSERPSPLPTFNLPPATYGENDDPKPLVLGSVDEEELGIKPETTDPAGTSSLRGPLYSSPSSLDDRLLMELFYASLSLGYGAVLYGEKKPASLEDFGRNGSEPSSAASDIESDVIAPEQAEETFKNIQYAALTGTKSEVDGEERRRFDWWIKFNPVLFQLMEAMYGLTRDVNYGSYV